VTRTPIAVAGAERRFVFRVVLASVLGALVIVAAAGWGNQSTAKGARTAGAHFVRNGLIAYESDINSKVGGSAPSGIDVYVMNPDGSHKRQLTHTENSGEPRWSPDGRRIVFVRGGCHATRCQEAASALWVMNADGSGQRRLTSGRSIDNDPRWSPDGKYIAFTRGTACKANGCNLDIWLIRPDGTGARQLTRDGRSSWPTWSPDGKKIAVSCDSPDGSRSDICVMSSNGTGRRNLTAGFPASAASADQPAWSPDGRTIMYADLLSQEFLIFMPATGRDWRKAAVFRASGGDDVSEPAWSPDGTKIVFQRQQTIEVIAYPNGSKGKTVAFNGDNHNPDWQPLP
jgi:TolB protein